MTKWLSVKELSEETSIPTSTIRRYIDKFEDFFIQKEDHRPKQYEAAAATVLLKIKQLYDEGCQAEEINEALQKEFSLTTSEDQAAVSLDEEDTENTAEAADQPEADDQQPKPPEQPVQPPPQQEPDTKQILQEKDKQLIQSLRKSLREQQAISELVEASKESSVVGKKRSILKRLFQRKKD
ncbi:MULTISPECIES: MerR family transcriptional regulator [Priestia]|uniref:MerR family transcriptional regulator n=1 Tax=Priestia TaxID=2800373 RepID=UPI0014550737|nr:MerR family transcriptional regulator [Priestia aryabhattai]NLR44486.1 MerR family transcriptional regulator [Priestia megaterium]MBY0003858.1 MerR family transcriptional regulator [Priestia aryabhattai]MBY0046857.1 MerR family transcriptional regulator [Priestia aryabhattai]MDE8673004.1 MerR family transcriptional regulator [Priestia aryabhattai]MED3953091.1 MerR family transcriptional regulator [Priestia aryabhattai]